MKNLITIFTPTYNRCDTLKRLYNSLECQTNKNFEWVIVDDGSSDNTCQFLSQIKKISSFPLYTYSQDNSGKHIAINKGLDMANYPWFFIVDSDDYLPKNAINLILNYLNSLPSTLDGLVARKAHMNGVIIGDSFKKSSFISDSVDRKFNLRLNGDLAEIYKTAIMRDLKFPIFKGQKFCAEGLMWNRLAKNHKALFIDEVVYIAEYLEDGLSANSIKNRRNSPDYALMLYKELSEDERLSLLMKARTFINYWRFSFFTKKSILANWTNINFNLLALLLFPLGLLMKFKDDFKN